MSIVRQELHERLRFGVGSIGVDAEGQRQSGVVIFGSVPVGALVTAWVDSPTELNEESLGGAGASPSVAQAYAWEIAPEPTGYTAGGVSFRGRMRTLVTDGKGRVTPRQEEPDWASADTGSIIQKGKERFSIQMPGESSLTPNLKSADRNLLRLRWVGANPVAGETIGTGTGVANQVVEAQLGGAGTPSVNIAPGSLVVSLTIATASITLRDDGRGRVVGNGADGTIDYLTGMVRFTVFAGADLATNIDADYESDCAYRPLDAQVEYDLDMS